MSRFKKAVRTKARLRMAIDGPAGSGKSYTALRLAFALGKRVAVIDTERGSASLYQGEAPDGEPWDFDVTELFNYAPTEFTSAIQEAGRAGYDVLIIDSLSHAWSGEGGALELKDKEGGNSYTSWGKITPMQNRMIDAILTSPCHVFVTMRSKTEYILEPNEKGKMVPRKIGMAPIQRANMEFEFTIYGSMDWGHTLTVTKSRCPAVQDAVSVKPGPAFMDPIIAWLLTGTAAPVEAAIPPIGQLQVAVLAELMAACGINEQAMRSGLENKFKVSRLADLNESQGNDLQETLHKKKAQLAQQRAQQPQPEKAAENVSTNGQSMTTTADESEAEHEHV